MSDTTVAGQQFLEHYGKKGMKWGKTTKTASINLETKQPSMAKINFKTKDGGKQPGGGTVKLKMKGGGKQAAEVSVQSTLSLSGKTKIKTAGGGKEQASGDAIKVAAARQKLKKSGTNALSNKELQELSNRMNLENQVDRLSKEQISSGKKFVKKLVEPPKPQEIRRTLIDGAKRSKK